MPPPRPTPAAPPAPTGVRLDVRLGGGPPAPHPLADGAEFVVGGADGCHLRLPGTGVPAVVCRFVRTADALTVRRLDPAFPVLVNGTLAGLLPLPLAPGDRVAVGPADLSVNRDGGFLRPAFFPFPPPDAPPPADPLAAEREQLRADRQALAEEARELEADRVLWYRRRQELEAELAARQAEPDDREARLEATRQELESIRRGLHEQFEARRDQLAQMQEVVRTASADLGDRRRLLEAEVEDRLTARRAELEADAERRLAELAAREQQLAADRDAADRRATAVDARQDQLRRDARELEEHVALAGAERDHLHAEAARLARQQADLDALSGRLAQRAGEVEAERATLAVARAALDRREEAAQQEAARQRAESATAEAGASADIQAQKDHLAAEQARLVTKEAELDARSADTAEQAALLHGKLQQALDLQARLDADRAAVRDREAAVAAADAAQQTFQEQLRRRADELAIARAELDARRAELEAAGSPQAVPDAGRAEFDALLREVPGLDAHAREAAERLSAARAELAAARAELQQEADRLTAREQALDRSRADHQSAVSEFRDQLLGWQVTVAELKQALTRTEPPAEVAVVAPAAVPQEPQPATDSPGGGDLDDLRGWFRQTLAELARTRPAGPVPESDIDPADRQLGDLLRGRGLADADTVAALWADAVRQRKTLRQLLLASGAVTLYQLSLVEAGDLHRLHFGRLRVVDRVRATPREAVYRVTDPAGRELLLRHLLDGDADGFRRRFTALAGLQSPHLWATLEVVDGHGRPAAVQEPADGLPATDWPAGVAVPGVWLRLVTEVAVGLSVAHAAGLPHGRLTAESVWLAPDGRVKLLGAGEPGWLAGGPDGTPADDLRALGRLADGWAQAGGPVKRGRGKPFPDALLAVVRRLVAGPESPMADTPTGAAPYPSAEDLLDDLHRLGKLHPCPPDAWLAVAGADPEARRQSA